MAAIHIISKGARHEGGKDKPSNAWHARNIDTTARRRAAVCLGEIDQTSSAFVRVKSDVEVPPLYRTNETKSDVEENPCRLDYQNIPHETTPADVRAKFSLHILSYSSESPNERREESTGRRVSN